MVDLIGETFQIFFREKRDLMRLCVLVEVAGERFIPAFVALLVIRRVIRNDMSASIDNRVAHGTEKPPCRLAGGNAHHVPFFDTFSTAEREIHQNIRVIF